MAVGLFAVPLDGGIRPDTVASDLVIVREADVITEDLFAAGERVIVRGVIQGDLIAASFNDVLIEGTIEGDVLAVASEVRITGQVDGSVRVLSGTLVTDGSIADDVAAATWKSRIGGLVGRDVLAFGWSLEVPGTVGRELRAQMADRIAVSGDIGADAEVNARVNILTGAVGGDFRYRGDAEVGSTATVDGLSAELGRLPVPIRVRTLLFGSALLSLMALIGLAVAAWWLAPSAMSRAIQIGRRPWVGMVVGLGLAFVPPVVLALAIAGTAAVSADLVAPALIVVVPFAMAYLGALALLLIAGLVPASTLVGGLIPGRRSVTAEFALGAGVWLAVWFLLPLGPLLLAGALLMGAGSVLVATRAQASQLEP